MEFETEKTPGTEIQVPDVPREAEMPQHRNKQKRTVVKNAMVYLHDLAYLLAIVMLLFLLVFRVVVVSGSSMYDTLVDGDYLLLVSSVLYTQPEQGDVIVACKDSFENGMPIVKRVIALGGQTVYIDFEAGIVYVDGEALNEPYTHTLTTRDEGMEFPVTVPEGCVFVMGDNRDRSQDSRYPGIGMIDEREILGKAVLLFFPGFDGEKESRDFARIGGVD